MFTYPRICAFSSCVQISSRLRNGVIERYTLDDCTVRWSSKQTHTHTELILAFKYSDNRGLPFCDSIRRSSRAMRCDKKSTHSRQGMRQAHLHFWHSDWHESWSTSTWASSLCSRMHAQINLISSVDMYECARHTLLMPLLSSWLMTVGVVGEQNNAYQCRVRTWVYAPLVHADRIVMAIHKLHHVKCTPTPLASSYGRNLSLCEKSAEMYVVHAWSPPHNGMIVKYAGCFPISNAIGWSIA